MSSVNVTIRVDADTKKEFDAFCDNVGLNMTTAVNLFIKNTLRTRQLPFVITDKEDNPLAAVDEFTETIKASDEAETETVRVKLCPKTDEGGTETMRVYLRGETT